MKDVILTLISVALFAASAVSFARIIGITDTGSVFTPTTVGAGLLAAIVSYLIYRKRR